MPLLFGLPETSNSFTESSNLDADDVRWLHSQLNFFLLYKTSNGKDIEEHEVDIDLVNPFAESDFPGKFENIATSLRLPLEKIVAHKEKLLDFDLAQSWALTNIRHANYKIRNLCLAIFLAKSQLNFTNELLGQHKEIIERHLTFLNKNSKDYYHPILFLYCKVNFALLLLKQPSESIIKQQNSIRLVFKSIDNDLENRKDLRLGKVWAGAFFFSSLYSLGDSKDNNKLLLFRQMLESNVLKIKNQLVNTFNELGLITSPGSVSSSLESSSSASKPSP